MSDHSFLAQFITEPLYLIKDESVEANPYTEPKAEETTQVEEPKEKVALKPVRTSGQNLKGCIILVDWKAGEVAEEKDLLLKILGSVKRTENDVLIAHAYDTSNEQIEALLAEQNHKHVLDFGTDSLAHLTQIKPYEIKENGPKRYLKADALSSISTDVELKKALWKALQSMFL